MNRFSPIIGFVVIVLWAAAAAAETPNEQPKAQEIPLDQIWGFRLPGTREVQELEWKPGSPLSSEGFNEYTRRSDVWKIVKMLSRPRKEGETAGPAFVVVGTGKEALENAQIVFSSGTDTKTIFPADMDLTLVWFSRICGQPVRLLSVKQSPELFTVNYQFVAHQNPVLTGHFALIPLGKLSEGTYEVKVTQLESIDEQGRPAASIRDPQRLVSDSFSFTVRKE